MFYKDQKEEILKVTDYGYDIFRKYVNPGIKLGKTVLSPLREEKTPSFSIYNHGRRGDVWYKDFSLEGDTYHGDCFQFVQALYNLSSFTETIDLIKRDVLGIYGNDKTQMATIQRRKYTPRPAIVKEIVELIPEYRDFNKYDLQWWNRFMIDQNTLHLFMIRPATFYTKIKESKTIKKYEKDYDPIYVIDFLSGRRKMYRPLTENKAFKWESNVIADLDIFGLHLLPEYSEDLFILAGNKDTMSFWATTGIPAVALQSESARLTEIMAMYLESKAKNVHVFYDNDKAGNTYSTKLCMEHNYQSHGYLLEKYNVNDYSELVDKHPEYLSDFFTRLKISMKSRVKKFA